MVAQNMHGHGLGMHQHDEVNMPGLRGENATQEESAELAVVFRNFDTITREVENLRTASGRSRGPRIPR